MVAERCVSKSGAVSADPHHTCRYGSSPAAHRLVVPALSFPSDREPSLSHRSRACEPYTRTDQPQPIDAIGPDLRSGAWGHVPRRALKLRAVPHDRPIPAARARPRLPWIVLRATARDGERSHPHAGACLPSVIARIG